MQMRLACSGILFTRTPKFDVVRKGEKIQQGKTVSTSWVQCYRYAPTEVSSGWKIKKSKGV